MMVLTKKFLGILIVLQVAHFTQAYPYIHFHNNGAEDEPQIVISVHPLDFTIGNQQNYGSRSHRHRNNDHLVGDFTLIKRRLDAAFWLLTAGCVSTNLVKPLTPGAAFLAEGCRRVKPIRNFSASCQSPRSPPRLG